MRFGLPITLTPDNSNFLFTQKVWVTRSQLYYIIVVVIITNIIIINNYFYYYYIRHPLGPRLDFYKFYSASKIWKLTIKLFLVIIT